MSIEKRELLRIYLPHLSYESIYYADSTSLHGTVVVSFVSKKRLLEQSSDGAHIADVLSRLLLCQNKHRALKRHGLDPCLSETIIAER